ncbi:MAG: discoidin domain-containing protein [Phycisphaerales bacterium]|nr:discoidin domain-containing protein [Phycisphaerales bacterium]
MKRYLPLLAVAAMLAAVPAYAQLANLKVVTDANPDYSDMESMVRSINLNWPTDKEKMWAQYYWHHKARRAAMESMIVHGFALADPIRQYNDYGYLMCFSTSGLQCSVWNYMNYPCRYWDIATHSAVDVWYDGRFHHYDNAYSAHYALEDGVTVAGVPDVGRLGKGLETDGQEVLGYLAMYRCLDGTGPNGYLTGSDMERTLHRLGTFYFAPNVLQYRWYYYNQDRGHRYSLNLRDGEVYTRYYSRQDADSPNAVVQREDNKTHKADPAYFVPVNGKDPEAAGPRLRLRGSGERTWTPDFTFNLRGEYPYSLDNIRVSDQLQPEADGKPGIAIFKVEGANVITSLKINATIWLPSVKASAAIAISTNNGLHWKTIWTGKAPNNELDLKLIDEVNGSYEVLVKVILNAPAKEPWNAVLKSINFTTITQVNSKTQPQLKIGKNTVYVGNGDQTGTITLWPQLHDDAYKSHVFEEQNVKTPSKADFRTWTGSIFPADFTKDGYIVFKIDAPTDLTCVTYGGRFYNRAPKAHIDMLHSFDGGQTWTKSYSLTDTKAPWDVIHYETVTAIPPGTRSVLFKYLMNSPSGGPLACSIYAVHMEANHKLAAPSNGPMEVTFNWSERQEDYSLIKRSHTQLVDKLPATYTINVGGADHPVVDSLTVNLKGARKDVKYGYSDDKDVGGEKWTGVWATYGNNLAAHKPYTASIKPLPAAQSWGANDDSGKRLTDTFVGSGYNGGVNTQSGAMWKDPVDITVDLGKPEACKAFRIHIYGWGPQDAIKGEVKDKVEVLTSLDGENFTSTGNFDFNLRGKDIPENFTWNDEETFKAHNHTLPLKDAVNARYVKFKVTPGNRMMGISEVQVLDGYEFKPFSMRLALPDPAGNGKAPPNAGVSPNARKWGSDEKLPQTIGKPWKPGGNNVDD